MAILAEITPSVLYSIAESKSKKPRRLIRRGFLFCVSVKALTQRY